MDCQRPRGLRLSSRNPEGLRPPGTTVVARAAGASGLADGASGGLYLVGALGHELDLAFPRPPATGGTSARIKRDKRPRRKVE